MNSLTFLQFSGPKVYVLTMIVNITVCVTDCMFDCVFCSLLVLCPPTGLKVQRPSEQQHQQEEEEEGKAKPGGRKEKEAKPNLNHLKRPTPGNWNCSTG